VFFIAAVDLTTIVALFLVLGSQSLHLEYSVPPIITGLLLLPPLSAVLVGSALVTAVFDRRARRITRRGAAGLALMALTGLAFLLWLNYWNLLGFRW
jgi:hypothetical protein